MSRLTPRAHRAAMKRLERAIEVALLEFVDGRLRGDLYDIQLEGRLERGPRQRRHRFTLHGYTVSDPVPWHVDIEMLSETGIGDHITRRKRR